MRRMCVRVRAQARCWVVRAQNHQHAKPGADVCVCTYLTLRSRSAAVEKVSSNSSTYTSTTTVHNISHVNVCGACISSSSDEPEQSICELTDEQRCDFPAKGGPIMYKLAYAHTHTHQKSEWVHNSRATCVRINGYCTSTPRWWAHRSFIVRRWISTHVCLCLCVWSLYINTHTLCTIVVDGAHTNTHTHTMLVVDT